MAMPGWNRKSENSPSWCRPLMTTKYLVHIALYWMCELKHGTCALVHADYTLVSIVLMLQTC